MFPIYVIGNGGKLYEYVCQSQAAQFLFYAEQVRSYGAGSAFIVAQSIQYKE